MRLIISSTQRLHQNRAVSMMVVYPFYPRRYAVARND